MYRHRFDAASAVAAVLFLCIAVVNLIGGHASYAVLAVLAGLATLGIARAKVRRRDR